MAIIFFSAAADMSNPQFQLSGTLTTVSAGTHYRFTSGNVVQDIYGIGLISNGSTLTGGTVTQLSYEVDGFQQYSIVSMAHSAPTLLGFGADFRGLLEFLLNGNDAVFGSSLDGDVLAGFDGNDILFGDEGSDTATYAAASGAVTVSLAIVGAQATGGAGSDTLFGIENLTGSAFDDLLTGDDGDNLLEGGAGDDTLDGAGGTDTASYAHALGVTVSLAIGGQQDTGNAGLDTLTGIENLTGSAFDDLLSGDDGDNVLVGGDGTDTVSYALASGGVLVDLGGNGVQDTFGAGNDTLFSIENLVGSAFDDQLIGDFENNVLEGGVGDDILDGGEGEDSMSGGDGNDRYYVDDLNDTYFEDINEGIDRVFTSISGVPLPANFENVTYVGPAGGGIVGNNDANHMQGNSDNTMNGLGGNDTLVAGGGSNTFFGGTGSDELLGAGGVDFLDGGSGNDSLEGNGGDDELEGFAGIDVLDGGSGADEMAGGLGADTYYVDDMGDTVFEANNTPSGVEGFRLDIDLDNIIDRVIASIAFALGAFVEDLELAAGAGNLAGTGNELDNVLAGNEGDNLLEGGAGSDTASYARAGAAVTVNLEVLLAQNTVGAGTDTLASIENLTGGLFNDTLTGDAAVNRLEGSDGNDTLNGGAGADTMIGGLGNDTYVVNSVVDVVTEILNSGTDLVRSTATSHTLSVNVENLMLLGTASINGTGNTGNNVFTGNSGSNALNGGTGNDTASYASAAAGVTVSLAIAGAQNTVGAGSDTLTSIENLTGSAFSDTLTGGTGSNVLTGGAGNDIYVVGAGDSTLEGAGAGEDLVKTSVSWTLAANVEQVQLIGSTAINGTGNSLDNWLIGNGAANVLNGSVGVDTASYGGAASAVTVSLAIAAAQNTVGAGMDTLIGIENLNGGAFNDTLTGNAENNALNGRAGDDKLNGGLGSDTAIYAGAAAAVTVSLAITGAQNTVGAGSDTLTSIENLTGSALDDTLTGNSAANVLDGAAGRDTMNGGAGNDTLNGGLGNDAMAGGTGADAFLFASALGAANIDQVVGFSVVADTIRLENAIFTSLVTPGTLAAASFRAGAGFTAAADVNDFIIFNTSNGELFYDAGGNTGASSVHFATLTGVVGVVTAADFLVV